MRSSGSVAVLAVDEGHEDPKMRSGDFTAELERAVSEIDRGAIAAGLRGMAISGDNFFTGGGWAQPVTPHLLEFIANVTKK